ncbi:hypothetical protein KKG81_14095 [bacterium]|nr:hypothetical protein [bacterium]
MLMEIRCEHFNQKCIEFHSGLNVILGDSKASNSIGKTTLLSIIDFIFGGKTYLEHNTGSLEIYGLHSFSFKFVFKNIEYFFIMNTNREKVYKCNSKYEILDQEPLTIDEYLDFLKNEYSFSNISLSFRSIISILIRIWGKGNDFVDKPLKLHKDSSDKLSVENLVKLFQLYEKIKEINEKLKDKKENKTTYTKADKYKLINKITKTQYKNNLIELNITEKKIDEVKKNLINFTKDITQIVNEEILSLNSEKEKILSTLNYYNNKLERLKRNLEQKAYIKSKNLEKLKEFFPSVNLDKIEEIEEFHNGISKILKNELKKDIKATENSILEIKEEYEEILIKIEKYYKVDDNSKVVYEKVYELALKKNKLETENQIYLNNLELIEEIKEVSNLLEEKVKDIYEEINLKVNKKIYEINKFIYEDRKSPEFKINENSNYTYLSREDRGTGKSYSNLLIFDMVMNELCNIPLLIHDSFLYKNIQNETIEKFIKKYNILNGQSFISIDEIDKYSKSTIQIINKQKVIELTKTNILFTKNWKLK